MVRCSRDLDAATQEHALAVPAGIVSHTGVGGLVLGGGMGLLTRLHGLSIDNLESVQIVTADGSLRRAAADENADLFWAVRGGGGNFGVVTEFEFRLHPAGPIVNYGIAFWDAEQGAELFRAAREMVPALPREVNVVIACLNAPPAPFVPEEHHFKVGYAVIAIGFGSPEQHADAMQQLRGTLPPPLFEFATPMPYVAVQQSIDEPNDWGMYHYEKGAYLEALTDEAIDVITEQFPQKTSPLSVTMFYHLDHGYLETADDATAFSGQRTERYAMFVIATTPVPEALDAERAWVRTFWDTMQPYTADIGSYVNGMTEPDEARIRASYGDEVRAAPGDQAEVRPGQRLPPKPEHQALNGSSAVHDQDLAVEVRVFQQEHPDDRKDLLRLGQVTGRRAADDLVELGLAEDR